MKKDKIIFDKEKSEYNYKGTEVVSDNSDEVDENYECRHELTIKRKEEFEQ